MKFIISSKKLISTICHTSHQHDFFQTDINSIQEHVMFRWLQTQCQKEVQRHLPVIKATYNSSFSAIFSAFFWAHSMNHSCCCKNPMRLALARASLPRESKPISPPSGAHLQPEEAKSGWEFPPNNFLPGSSDFGVLFMDDVNKGSRNKNTILRAEKNSHPLG